MLVLGSEFTLVTQTGTVSDSDRDRTMTEIFIYTFSAFSAVFPAKSMSHQKIKKKIKKIAPFHHDPNPTFKAIKTM